MIVWTQLIPLQWQNQNHNQKTKFKFSYPSKYPLYIGPNMHTLYEASQEVVAYTHALHAAL